LQIAESLIAKILDDSSNNLLDEDYFADFDEEELEMLNKFLDNLELFIEVMIPLFLLIIPLSIWLVRRGILTSRRPL
jgi:hypothetical protein